MYNSIKAPVLQPQFNDTNIK